MDPAKGRLWFRPPLIVHHLSRYTSIEFLPLGLRKENTSWAVGCRTARQHHAFRGHAHALPLLGSGVKLEGVDLLLLAELVDPAAERGGAEGLVEEHQAQRRFPGRLANGAQATLRQ